MPGQKLFASSRVERMGVDGVAGPGARELDALGERRHSGIVVAPDVAQDEAAGEVGERQTGRLPECARRAHDLVGPSFGSLDVPVEDSKDRAGAQSRPSDEVVLRVPERVERDLDDPVGLREIPRLSIGLPRNVLAMAKVTVSTVA